MPAGYNEVADAWAGKGDRHEACRCDIGAGPGAARAGADAGRHVSFAPDHHDRGVRGRRADRRPGADRRRPYGPHHRPAHRHREPRRRRRATGGARGARAEPDGYTLTVGSLGSHGAAAALYRSIQYDARELEPIGLIAGTPGYFVVRKDFPARTMPEFLAHAKANPGKVTNGHAGVGSTPHLACLFLAHLTGMSLVSTPYRGSGPAMNDLVAGQIDSMCDLAPTVVPQIQAGTIRGLMLAQPERSPATPDVPTSKE